MCFAAQKSESEALENQFHNLVLSALTSLAITVDSAFDEIFGRRCVLGIESIDSLHNFFYLLRCAVAHDTIDSRWKHYKHLDSYTITIPKEVTRKLSQDQSATEKTITVNFKKLDNKTGLAL